MKRITTFAGFLTGICIVLAVLGLGISPVSAAQGTPLAFNGTGFHGPGTANHVMNATQQLERLQTAITKLGSTGVDVTEPRADISSGDLKAAMTWLMNYHKAHPETQIGAGRQNTVNSTRMTAMFNSAVTKLSSLGVDVTQLQTDITSGDMKAAGQWLATYHKDHPAQQGNATKMQWGNVTAQTERLQSAITKLSTQGVDVSQPQADITSGDLKAAMQWLAAYHKDHPEQMIDSARQGNTSTVQKGKAGFGFHHRAPAATTTSGQA